MRKAFSSLSVRSTLTVAVYLCVVSISQIFLPSTIDLVAQILVIGFILTWVVTGGHALSNVCNWINAKTGATLEHSNFSYGLLGSVIIVFGVYGFFATVIEIEPVITIGFLFSATVLVGVFIANTFGGTAIELLLASMLYAIVIWFLLVGSIYFFSGVTVFTLLGIVVMALFIGKIT